MKEHPVLPDLSPAKALHVLFVVLADIAAILGGVLLAGVLVAVVLDRLFLATIAGAGVLLCGAAAIRLIAAQHQLEDHRV